MSDLETLVGMCKARGLAFRSVFLSNDSIWIFMAHSPEIAGTAPRIENMRDGTDYVFAMNSWNRKGSVILGYNKDYALAYKAAIKFLREGMYVA